MSPETRPYGAWQSPLAADTIARGAKRLVSVAIGDDGVYWVESRPAEQGRYVLVLARRDGTTRDVTPPGFSVRTRVHEYGGGASLVAGRTIFFSNYEDQRLYRQDGPDGAPHAITAEPERPSSIRYADYRLTPDGRTLVCVRERHDDDGVANEIVALATDGSGEQQVLVTGGDFYAAPRISPDGRRLAWVTWNHPRMPWDGSEVWVGDLGAALQLGSRRRVAGGPGESAYQPRWAPDGALCFLSDPTGWWNLHRLDAGSETAVPLLAMEADFGEPQWSFDASTYAVLDDGRLACSWISGGHQRLGLLDPGSGELEPFDLPYADFAQVRARGTTLAFLAGGPTEADSVVTLDLAGGPPRARTLARAFDLALDPAHLSRPEPIEFPTDGGATAHALFYPPTNPDFAGPEGERPPLLVLSHGGPTSRAVPSLDPSIQFWTSRGFALVDVNYGGSSGYGRAYRDRLNGRWGIVDVADCVNAARYLAQRGDVDGKRMAIRGGSAGGYTTLAALTFHDVFTAGASYFGVADLAALAADTHKFESRYLDSLVGPYPEAADLYRQRSPIHFTDRLSCPIILFQGLEDEVVPPSQAEQMVAALAAKGLPHAYLAFEGEQHGFRRAETNRATLEAELSFYAQIFGFEPADPIEPVRISRGTG